MSPLWKFPSICAFANIAISCAPSDGSQSLWGARQALPYERALPTPLLSISPAGSIDFVISETLLSDLAPSLRTVFPKYLESAIVSGLRAVGRLNSNDPSAIKFQRRTDVEVASTSPNEVKGSERFILTVLAPDRQSCSGSPPVHLRMEAFAAVRELKSNGKILKTPTGKNAYNVVICPRALNLPTDGPSTDEQIDAANNRAAEIEANGTTLESGERFYAANEKVPWTRHWLYQTSTKLKVSREELFARELDKYKDMMTFNADQQQSRTTEVVGMMFGLCPGGDPSQTEGGPDKPVHKGFDPDHCIEHFRSDSNGDSVTNRFPGTQRAIPEFTSDDLLGIQTLACVDNEVNRQWMKINAKWVTPAVRASVANVARKIRGSEELKHRRFLQECLAEPAQSK